MSILSSLYHGLIRDNPNAARNVKPGQRQDIPHMEAVSARMGPQPVRSPADDRRAEAALLRRQLACERSPLPRMSRQQAQRQARKLNSIAASRAAWQAQLEGGLRPDLYYSIQQGAPGPEGWVESPRTVADKLENREEFPRG